MERNGPHEAYEHIIPDINEWPIADLSKRRSVFVKQLQDFTYGKLTKNKSFSSIKEFIEKTIYLEKSRVKNVPWRVDPPNEMLFWNRLQQKIANIQDPSNEVYLKEVYTDVLKTIIHRYSEEIVGTFHSNSYLFARRFLTAFFKLLFNKWWGKTGIFFGRKSELLDRLHIYGPIGKLRTLAKKHTLVLVPTHSSNLDSIMVGYAIDSKVGLPSFSYGAGLNLYNFGPAAYFMNRLGAYRVDRRKKNPIYLECLISMSQLSIQDGVNSLFFAGGTRSRSGALESRLKLGLMSSMLFAQRKLCEREIDKKVIVVPLILSYNFVLEARGLVEQHLKSTGQEKYVKSASTTKNIIKSLGYFFRFFYKTSEVSLSFGEPMDVFGNKIDNAGNSLDEFGNKLNVRDYFVSNGLITEDNQRESEYTNLFAAEIVKRFKSDNVVLPSQLIAFVAFKLLMYDLNQNEIFDIFRIKPKNYPLHIDRVSRVYSQVLTKLKDMQSKKEVILGYGFKEENVVELIKLGVRKLGVFHTKLPLKFKNEQTLISEDFQILYFYHNRLEGYGLEEVIDLKNN